MNGSWPSVCGPPVGVFVAPNVLRFGRGAPSDVRVTGNGAPVADTGVDAGAAGVEAAVALGVAAAAAVGPEATDGVPPTGPD